MEHFNLVRSAGASACQGVAEIEDFDAVVRLHWPRIFRFALARLGDRDLAQTVAQDCFLRAHRGRDTFRGEASLQTWLMRIAANLVADNARSRKRRFWRRASQFPVHDAIVQNWIRDTRIDPERRILVRERMEAVRSAAAHLPERERLVFVLRYVEELAFPIISAITGLNEGAARGRAYRALNRVRNRVGR